MAKEAESNDDGSVCVTVSDLVRLQYQARQLPLARSSKIDNVLVGRHRSSVRGRGLDFEELRQYRQGDDIRQMDWKVTNRTRKPHVRVYAEERERPVIVIVDQRLSMFFGSRLMMKSVAAAQMAALVGWKSLAQGDRVGSVIFNDHSISEIPARATRQHLMQTFHSLEDYGRRLKTAQQGSSAQLNHALKKVVDHAGHDALIYLISDLDGADERSGEYLSALARRNSVILGFVYDPMEQNLPEGGKLAVSDGQYQVEIDTSDETLRNNFDHQFQARLTQARQFLRARQVPVLPISAAQTVESQLITMMSGGN
ncbi:MAG: DUF58 domain-containing protein [Cellvibrionaceae bacterium]